MDAKKNLKLRCALQQNGLGRVAWWKGIKEIRVATPIRKILPKEVLPSSGWECSDSLVRDGNLFAFILKHSELFRSFREAAGRAKLRLLTGETSINLDQREEPAKSFRKLHSKDKIIPRNQQQPHQQPQQHQLKRRRALSHCQVINNVDAAIGNNFVWYQFVVLDYITRLGKGRMTSFLLRGCWRSLNPTLSARLLTFLRAASIWRRSLLILQRFHILPGTQS